MVKWNVRTLDRELLTEAPVSRQEADALAAKFGGYVEPTWRGWNSNHIPNKYAAAVR